MIDYMDEKDGITYKKHEYAYIEGIAKKNNNSANYVLLM